MNEEKKLNDETLEGVSGGYEDRYNDDPGIRGVQKWEECYMRCHNRDTDACPHRDDLKDFMYKSAEHG